MLTLENEHLIATVAPKGAEVQRLFGKHTGLEYLWGGRADAWPRHSPLLFPFIGSLTQGKYLLDGKTWSMGSHGFCRDAEFKVAESGPTSARLVYTDSEATRSQYPFAFVLEVGYELVGDGLKTTWTVTNLSATPMPFSIGAHPGFSTKMLPADQFSDYSLQFSRPESLQALEWNEPTLLLKRSVKDYGVSDRLELKHELFDAVALVFEGIQSPVTLKSRVHGHGVRYEFPGFPWMTVWSPKGKQADFVCLEPWFGIPDYEDGPFEAKAKRGVRWLEPRDQFKAEQRWHVF